MAILQVTVVLPSFDPGLVTTITLPRLKSSVPNISEATLARNASATRDSRSCHEISSVCLAVSMFGTRRFCRYHLDRTTVRESTLGITPNCGRRTTRDECQEPP